jgi:hypothetical protein
MASISATMDVMGSKRERHRQNLIRRASRRRVRVPPTCPSQSETFPWLQASGPLPRWMFFFGVLGVGALLVSLLVAVLALHHWI